MSVTVDHSRSLEQKLEIVTQTGLLLARNTHLESIVQRATDVGLQVTGAEFGSFVCNQTAPHPGTFAFYTVSGSGPTRSSTFPARGTVASPLKDPTIIRSRDITRDTRFRGPLPSDGLPHNTRSIRSYLAVPVRILTGEILGVLVYGHEEPDAFDEVSELLIATIAAQAAFCFVVLFVAGLFVVTFNRLSHQPTGFSAERLINLDTLSPRQQPMAFWDQVTDRLRALPGVETVALAGWPLLNGNGWNGVISVGGAQPAADLAYFLNVSPGWADTMKIPLLAGRDFRQTDAYPGAAIVNQAFAKRYFDGPDPVGKLFEKVEGDGARTRFQVVGLLRDARYRNMREPITPTAYVPIYPQPRSSTTFIVRTSGANPAALASVLRHEIPRARPEFRVTNIRTQLDLNRSHTVRERLLAMLALFFAVVAVLLAGVGLYGVLDYSVLQRRREIGIRMAVGAPAANIARLVTVEIFAMVLVGSLAGLALGLASVRYIQALLYQVKGGDPAMLTLPSLTILAAALLAALPAVIHAVQIDPVEMLRSE